LELIIKGHGKLHNVYKCLFEMKSEHSWTKFICETYIKLNKLSYQIMPIYIKFKSMILEDDINKVKWMTLKFMERKMLYFICC